ncbi:FAD synthetase family protein [Bacillus sp. JJ634]
MKIHNSGNIKLPESVLTIGALDGIHKGHQLLLNKTKERAKKLGVPFVVYTFDPPPKVYFTDCPLLTTLEEKLQLLQHLGADHVIIGKFNEAFTKQEVPVFIEELKKLHPIEIWEGPNFMFGKDRKGNIDILRRYFKVEVLPPLTCIDNKMISSSRIRRLLQEGQYSEAQHLLGWDTFTPYSIKNNSL